MLFKELLYKYRDMRGMSLTDIGKSIGTRSEYIGNIEKGHQKPPTVERCHQIAKALRLSPEETQDLIDAAMRERLPSEALEWIQSNTLPVYKIPIVSLSQLEKLDFTQPILPQITTPEPDAYVWSDEKGARMFAVEYIKTMGGEFSEGDFLVVDPERSIAANDWVLVKGEQYQVKKYNPEKTKGVIGKIVSRHTRY